MSDTEALVHMTAAPDSPHRGAALMEAAGAAGLHKLTSRVFWLGSEQATYGDRFQTSRGRNIVAAAPAKQASPQVPKLTDPRGQLRYPAELIERDAEQER